MYDYEALETPEENQAHIDVVLRDGAPTLGRNAIARRGCLRCVGNGEDHDPGGTAASYIRSAATLPLEAGKAALSETEEKFHAFISESAYGYSELNPRHNLFVNRRLAEIWVTRPMKCLGITNRVCPRR